MLIPYITFSGNQHGRKRANDGHFTAKLPATCHIRGLDVIPFQNSTGGEFQSSRTHVPDSAFRNCRAAVDTRLLGEHRDEVYTTTSRGPNTFRHKATDAQNSAKSYLFVQAILLFCEEESITNIRVHRYSRRDKGLVQSPVETDPDTREGHLSSQVAWIHYSRAYVQGLER